MAKGNRVNTHFRQTVKAFKAARQTQVFSHIKRNIPQRIYNMTKGQFRRNLQKINKIRKVNLLSFSKKMADQGK